MSQQQRRMLDFDAEARNLWARLNLDPMSRPSGQWNPLDSIYRHPTGGGTIYVGNQMAAENLTLLRTHNISHVVNCTFGESKIPDYHLGKLQYYNFPVSHWPLYVNSTHSSVLAMTDPLFAFIDSAIANGKSVLVSFLFLLTIYLFCLFGFFLFLLFFFIFLRFSYHFFLISSYRFIVWQVLIVQELLESHV